jgi:hypothetical protein
MNDATASFSYNSSTGVYTYTPSQSDQGVIRGQLRTSDSAEQPRIWADSLAFLKRQWASQRRNWGFFSRNQVYGIDP